jgi:hypothetical protein
LAVHITKIIVKTKGTGVTDKYPPTLGPILGEDSLAYGFTVEIRAETTAGDTIENRDVTFTQFVFQLISARATDGTYFYFLRDGTHPGKPHQISLDEWKTAHRAWLTNAEAYDIDATQSTIFAKTKGKAMGRDWVKWGDASPYPGPLGAPELPRPRKLPAKDFQWVDVRQSFKVVATGTDGKRVTARFWFNLFAEPKDGKWTLTTPTAPASPETLEKDGEAEFPAG